MMLRRTFGKLVAGIFGIFTTRSARAETPEPCTECPAPCGEQGFLLTHARTEEELRAEYWAWVRRENDLHDEVVAKIKAKIKAKGETNRLVHRRETSVFT